MVCIRWKSAKRDLQRVFGAGPKCFRRELAQDPIGTLCVGDPRFRAQSHRENSDRDEQTLPCTHGVKLQRPKLTSLIFN
jgi:hypothetical protein